MSEVSSKNFKKAFEALARFQAAEAAYEDSAAVAKMLRSESDRALVIILASYIEDALLDRVIYMLPEGERYGINIFKSGSLRNFEHRIAIAKALGAISENNAQILDGIRAMRNACSHCRKPLSFETPELLDAFATTLNNGPGIFLSPENPSETRGAFILLTSMLLWQLRSAPGETAPIDTSRAVPESVRTEQLLLAALRKKLPPRVPPT